VLFAKTSRDSNMPCRHTTGNALGEGDAGITVDCSGDEDDDAGGGAAAAAGGLERDTSPSRSSLARYCDAASLVYFAVDASRLPLLDSQAARAALPPRSITAVCLSDHASSSARLCTTPTSRARCASAHVRHTRLACASEANSGSAAPQSAHAAFPGSDLMAARRAGSMSRTKFVFASLYIKKGDSQPVRRLA